MKIKTNPLFLAILILISPSAILAQTNKDFSNQITNFIKQREKEWKMVEDVRFSTQSTDEFSGSETLMQVWESENAILSIIIYNFISEKDSIYFYKGIEKQGPGLTPSTDYIILETSIKDLPEESYLQRDKNGYNNPMVLFRMKTILVMVSTRSEEVTKQFSKYVFEAIKVE